MSEFERGYQAAISEAAELLLAESREYERQFGVHGAGGAAGGVLAMASEMVAGLAVGRAGIERVSGVIPDCLHVPVAALGGDGPYEVHHSVASGGDVHFGVLPSSGGVCRD